MTPAGGSLLNSPAQPKPVWAGRIDARATIDPASGSERTGTAPVPPHVRLDIAVRLHIVTPGRTLAVADRDALRGRVESPFEPLNVDDLISVLVDGELCLRIDGAGPYALTAKAFQQFVDVL